MDDPEMAFPGKQCVLLGFAAGVRTGYDPDRCQERYDGAADCFNGRHQKLLALQHESVSS